MVNLNQTMKRLIINSCGFDLQGLSDFLSKMAENKSLETLSLDRPVLPNVQEGGIIEQFAKIIPASRSLAHLSLKHHLLYDHHAKVLADALFINDRMVSLNLESNRIGVIGAEALASCILKQQQRSLQYLGLSYNKIGNDGAIALAEVSRST
jgi:Ran GTPase-activating protein (RanGAP) involved in mRNA processing and transport